MLSYSLIALLILSAADLSWPYLLSSSLRKGLFRSSRSFPRILPLRETSAVPTEEIIEPAKYIPDLYGVLGVSKNATLKELKQSYWNIALNNHPDRNDSMEALYIFQNASYAYNILGRDPKKRQEYDTKLETKEIISTLEQVGNGAANAAIPILNMTYNAALPFLKDAFDFSAAIYDALSDDPVDDNTGGIFERIATAVGIKSTEQRMRRSTLQLNDLAKSLNNTLRELSEAEANEILASEAYQAAKTVFLATKESAAAMSEELRSAANNLNIEIAAETNAKTELGRQEEAAELNMKKSFDLNESISVTTREIYQLEEQLAQKRELLFRLQEEGSQTVASYEKASSNAEDLRLTYNEKVALRIDVESIYREADSKVKSIQAELDIATKAFTVAEDAFNRQNAYLQSIAGKVNNTATKIAVLETSLESDYKDWMKAKEESEKEKRRQLELRKRMEEEATLAAEVAKMESLKASIDRRRREMEQIELERVKLEAMAKSEMEEMQKAEEMIRKKNSNKPTM